MIHLLVRSVGEHRAMTKMLCIALLSLAVVPVAYATPLELNPIQQAKVHAPQQSVVPKPVQAKFPKGVLPLTGLSVQMIGNAPELTYAVRDLQNEWQTRLNQKLPVGNGKIVVGTLQDAGLAAKVKAAGLKAEGKEAYALWVDASGAYVVGSDAKGAYYGVQTLRQLLTPQGLRFAQISDAPKLEERVAMIYLDQYSKNINDKLIPLLAQLKYNRLLIMSNYVQWDTAKAGGFAHPGGATKAEAKRIAELARSYGLEPIPLLETLGHVGWMFYGNKNKELRQDPKSHNPFAYDTLNPATYNRIILPILDEVVEVFKPQYVHIGHDEVRNRDRFPARENGKKVGFEKLFVDDVLKLYGHLKQKNVGTMIWHDIAFSDALIAEIPPKLPKDLKVAYWNYTPGTSYDLLGKIAKMGFPTWGASWNDQGNAESQAQTVVKYSGKGAIQTRWTGYFGNPSIWDGYAEQGVAYVRAANAFWNPTAGELAGADLMYRDLYQPTPFVAKKGHTVNLTPHITRTLADKDDGKGWILKGPEIDLQNLKTGVQQIGDYTFDVRGAVMLKGKRSAVKKLPKQATFEIGRKANSIAFLQTTGWQAPKKRELIGHYEITFADGSKARQPLEYGRHIRAWTDLLPSSMIPAPGWTGKTADGLEVNVPILEWKNPKPNQVIKSVTLVSEGRAANPALLGMTLID